MKSDHVHEVMFLHQYYLTGTLKTGERLLYIRLLFKDACGKCGCIKTWFSS